MASSGWQGDVTLQSGGFGYSYFKGNLRIDSISHSGNTVTVTGVFAVHNDGGPSSYYQFPINAAVDGSTSYQEVVAGNVWIANGEYKESAVTFSFNAAASDTSHSIRVLWNYNNGTASNYIDYTLTFDASLPPAPTMTFNSATKNSIKMNYSAGTNGMNVTVQYKLDSDGWTNISSGTSPMSGNFTVNNLLPNSSHTIKVRSHTSGGDVSGPTLTASTTDTPAKWYSSVNNTRKRDKKTYCSVNGTRKKVLKIYGSVNGARELCYEDPNL